MSKLFAVRIATTPIDSDNGYLSFLFLSLSSFCVTDGGFAHISSLEGRVFDPISTTAQLVFFFISSWHMFLLYPLEDDTECRRFH
jgi:hypothetical protein